MHGRRTATGCRIAHRPIVTTAHEQGSATIVRALDALNLQFPRVDKASLEEFKQVREALENEGKGGTRKVTAKAATKGRTANGRL